MSVIAPPVVKPLPAKPGSELAAALHACRNAFLGVGLMSAVINVLFLTSSFFMLEVYDRVIPSKSYATLIGLIVLAFGLFAVQGVLDLLRNRVLSRIGGAVDDALNARIYSALTRLPLKGRSTGDGLLPIRDLDQLRSFLSGTGPSAMFDLPWMPFYLAICFMFHFWIGIAATVGGLILVTLTWLTDKLSRKHARDAVAFGAQRLKFAEAGRRNAEVLQAMGMGQRAAAKFSKINEQYMTSQLRVTDVSGGLGSISRVLRLMLQSAVLAVGAFLVLKQEATAGIIIAGSILTARAVAPVELVIANWRGFISSRDSWRRLGELLKLYPALDDPLEMPAPKATFSAEMVTAVPPGSQTAVVQEVAFQLRAGQGLGIIGPSASGKSSLVRLLVGAWTPARGKVRLDGAALEQWAPEKLGRHLGYLPQDIELFEGTVTDNIARLDPNPDPTLVIAAAKAAGVHDLILRLSRGYETEIGEAGMVLSAGQRQRVGLARALYGDPFLVVLDEPYSNLDAEGEMALSQAIAGVRTRGGIVIVVAHRPTALANVDLVLIMKDGRPQAFGPRDEVLAKVVRPATAVPPRIAAG